MKPSSWDKQLGLASPLECAASQSGQTNNPSKECGGAGCKSPYPHLPEGRGEAFLLDILFHRMSDIGILQQSPSQCGRTLRNTTPPRGCESQIGFSTSGTPYHIN